MRRAARTDAVLFAAFAAYGIPNPIAEYRFHPSRKWRFDYAWPDKLVALEVEGGVWSGGRHTRGAGFLKDMEKYNEAAGLGWAVVRCTPSSLWHLATLNVLRRTMGIGAELQ